MADDNEQFYTFKVRAESLITVPAADECEGHQKAQLAFYESINQTITTSDLVCVSVNTTEQTGGNYAMEQ